MWKPHVHIWSYMLFYVILSYFFYHKNGSIWLFCLLVNIISIVMIIDIIVIIVVIVVSLVLLFFSFFLSSCIIIVQNLHSCFRASQHLLAFSSGRLVHCKYDETISTYLFLSLDRTKILKQANNSFAVPRSPSVTSFDSNSLKNLATKGLRVHSW